MALPCVVVGVPAAYGSHPDVGKMPSCTSRLPTEQARATMRRRDLSMMLLAAAASPLTRVAHAGLHSRPPGPAPVSMEGLAPGDTRRFASLAAAFDSNESELVIAAGDPAGRPSSEVRAGAAIRRISGSGTLRQAREDANLLVFDGHDGLTVEGPRFLGASGMKLPAAASGNTGLTIRNARRVVISGCTFERWRYYGLFLDNCEDVIVRDNRFSQCALPLRLRGCRRVEVARNRFEGSNLAPGVFTVAVGLESTDQNSYPPCSEITITENSISGFGNAQGVLVHAGSRITIRGNVIRDAAMPISVNPFNETDVIDDVSIVDNVIECAMRGRFTNADVGINCRAGPGTPDLQNILVAGNVISHANRVLRSSEFGAIRMCFARDVTIRENRVVDAHANGILCTDCRGRVAIVGNSVEGVVAAGRVQRGIHLRGIDDGVRIDANRLANISGSGAVGIYSAACGGLSLGQNTFRNVPRHTASG